MSATQAIADILYQKNIEPSACGKIYRRELFDGLRFRPGILYEDLDLFYHIFSRAGRVVRIDTVTVYYRPNGQSILGVFTPRRFDVLDVVRRLEETASPPLARAARDRRLSANFNILGLLAAHDLVDTHRDVADSCLNLIKRYRADSLTNPRVRLKNKAGILLSYCGPRVLTATLAHFYRRQTKALYQTKQSE